MPASTRNLSRVNDSWLTINVNDYANLKNINFQAELQKKNIKIEKKKQHVDALSYGRQRVRKINLGDDRSAADKKKDMMPPAKPSYTLKRQLSMHEEAIISLKDYLPEKTLRYMKKRQVQRETSFMGYIGAQINSRFDAETLQKKQNEKTTDKEPNGDKNRSKL